MLLHPVTTTAAPLHRRRLSFSSSIPNLLQFPSGFSILTLKRQKSTAITCASISQVHSYGTVDYEKRPMPNWGIIYKRISMIEYPQKGASTVLNQCENEGKVISRLELLFVIRKLRKFRRHKLALEVCEWMNDRAERYKITTSDTAIQLDLISKVHGISNAEKYFLTLPNSLKDRRIYGSLLNAYVRVGMKEKAESLFDEMRNKGYTRNTLPYNLMLNLYMKVKDYDKLDSMICEMDQKNIWYNIFTYHILLSSHGYRGSIEMMERTFEKMRLDTRINPNWSTYGIMASVYIKAGELGKAEECLKKMKCIITGRDRTPYHHLFSLYAGVGNKEEVFRIWNVYKSNFPFIPNSSYHSIISSLLRLDDVEDAENIFDEWLSAKSRYDPRVANLLLVCYVRKGQFERAEGFLAQIIDAGVKPNPKTWEILADGHIKERRISDALSCLNEAVSAEGSKNWRPWPATISSFFNLCELENDMESKEILIEVLKQAGCLHPEDYTSHIPTPNGTNTNNEPDTWEDTFLDDNDDESADLLLGELHGSL
nr:pentatricopeptide repeat-containing protein At1g02150 [Ipomoea batatas]